MRQESVELKRVKENEQDEGKHVVVVEKEQEQEERQKTVEGWARSTSIATAAATGPTHTLHNLPPFPSLQPASSTASHGATSTLARIKCTPAMM